MNNMKTSEYLKNVGSLIQENRQARGMTQSELAEALGTSQSAVNRIEKGGQNISLEMIARIGDVLSSEIVRINTSGKTNFRVTGGRKLRGNIEVKTSKNAAVALLCASLLDLFFFPNPTPNSAKKYNTTSEHCLGKLHLTGLPPIRAVPP